MNFTAPFPNPPEMSLKARLSWEYFFGLSCGGWAAVKTRDGCWIVTDEGCDLAQASIYPDDDSFFEWLESAADDHLGDDRVGFIQNFCAIKELITDTVAREMEKVINASGSLS